MEMLLVFGALVAAMYFFMIRPQQKRQREQQERNAALGEGDEVLLTSGIFVKIKHLGDKQAIVETSPGNEMTILRQIIVREVMAEEQEFEYADESTTEYDSAEEDDEDTVSAELDTEHSSDQDSPEDQDSSDPVEAAEPKDDGSAASKSL